MKVVSTGKEYRIYSDHLRVYDSLPAGVYIVRFHQMQGFYLEEHLDIEVNEDKIYGVHLAKVDKVLRAFQQFKRNLGVILSGDKGIGKSLFAKIVSRTAIEQGYPVIIVDQFVPGISAFIEEIEQEVVVLFDEFDKTFAMAKGGDNGNSAQASLLSLLDGVAAGKKLYIVTCNNFQGLNDYLINRPGRFHYHFRFDYPCAEEIKIYLEDKIDKQYWSQIANVINFAGKVNLNYDCLRAISYELQNGELFEVAIKDLNILNLSEQTYNINVYFENGTMMYCRKYRMNLFDTNDSVGFWLSDTNGMKTGVGVKFLPSKSVYDITKACSVVTGDNLSLFYDNYYSDDDDTEEEKEEWKQLKQLQPSYLTISRSHEDNYHYTV